MSIAAELSTPITCFTFGASAAIVCPVPQPRSATIKSRGSSDSMAAVVKSIEGIKPKDMALDIGVPFHKGAAKFYKEAGAM